MLCTLPIIIAVLIIPLSEPKYITATSVGVAKSIGVSGVRLPRPLRVKLPVARRQRLGRTPPQEGGGAARRRWLRSVAGVTRSYLIAGAALNGGSVVGGDISSWRGVGIPHLQSKYNKVGLTDLQ